MLRKGPQGQSDYCCLTLGSNDIFPSLAESLFGWPYNKKYLFAKLVDIFKIQEEKKMNNFNELQGENA